MTLTEIKAAIADKLKTGLPLIAVYAKDVKQGFIKPAFFVEVIPARTERSVFYTDKTVSVKIRYFSGSNEYLDLADKADKLTELFMTSLTIGGIKITVLNMDNEIINGLENDYLDFSFDLNYIEWAEVLEIVNINGKTVFMLPDEAAGYIQENVSLMEELNLRQEE